MQFFYCGKGRKILLRNNGKKAIGERKFNFSSFVVSYPSYVEKAQVLSRKKILDRWKRRNVWAHTLRTKKEQNR